MEAEAKQYTDHWKALTGFEASADDQSMARGNKKGAATTGRAASFWVHAKTTSREHSRRKKDDERDRRYDKGSKKSTQRSTTVEAYSYLKCAKEDLQPPQPPNKTTTILHSVGIYHSTNLSPSFNPCQQACFAINMTPMLQYGAQKDACYRYGKFRTNAKSAIRLGM